MPRPAASAAECDVETHIEEMFRAYKLPRSAQPVVVALLVIGGALWALDLSYEDLSGYHLDARSHRLVDLDHVVRARAAVRALDRHRPPAGGC